MYIVVRHVRSELDDPSFEEQLQLALNDAMKCADYEPCTHVLISTHYAHMCTPEAERCSALIFVGCPEGDGAEDQKVRVYWRDGEQLKSKMELVSDHEVRQPQAQTAEAVIG